MQILWLDKMGRYFISISPLYLALDQEDLVSKMLPLKWRKSMSRFLEDSILIIFANFKHY